MLLWVVTVSLFSLIPCGGGDDTHTTRKAPTAVGTCKALQLYCCKDNRKNCKLQYPILRPF